MKVVMGCGWYTGDTHPDEVAQLSVEALAEQLICEIRNGVDDSGIKPGIIGEIGTGKEILPGEWKALEAAAIAQKASGLAIQVHIFPWSSNGVAVSEFLMKKGVDPRRIVICHSDVSPDYDYISALLRMGVWVQLDNFGKEFTPEAGGFAAGDFVRDTVRAEIAGRIIRDGFGSRLLMTNDICLKCMLSEYGGAGYTHVFTRAVPEIAASGIPVDYLKDVIMKKNPLEMLCGE